MTASQPARRHEDVSSSWRLLAPFCDRIRPHCYLLPAHILAAFSLDIRRRSIYTYVPFTLSFFDISNLSHQLSGVNLVAGDVGCCAPSAPERLCARRSIRLEATCSRFTSARLQPNRMSRRIEQNGTKLASVLSGAQSMPC
jgi:hypothetical protein